MISATSSFLSFSFRFFLLQILRFTMRDWLALPLSPSTLSSIKNNSDEDDCSYDIINRSVTEDDDDPEEQEISTWVTLLAVFGVVKERSRSAREGVAKKKERLRSVSSSASTREEEEVTKEDAVNKEAASTREGLSTKEGLSSECALTRKGLSTECAFTKQEEPRAFTREEESECSEIEETSDDEYEQEISMKRSLSASSIASSTDSDNSTPASSQIIRPSKFFEEMPLNTKTRSVQVSILIIN